MIGPICRCGQPHAMPELTLYCWPPGTFVSYRVDTSVLPAGLSADDARAAIEAGIAVWPQVCGVRVGVDQSPTAVPRVWIRFAAIDPTLVELGLTQLPSQGVAQVLMQLNAQVPWTMDELAKVAMHEFGHALGFVHTTGRAAVMNAFYDPAVDGPQRDDVVQALARYPRPVAPPPAPPPPPTTALPTLTVERSLSIDATFAEAGESILGVAIASAAPLAIPLRVPAVGTYRFTIEFESSP